MTNSRAKGAAGERELAKILREHGFDARRGQQYCGANGDADVVGLPGWHIECKRCQKYEIDKWWTQATTDCKESEKPLIAFRKNRGTWKVVLDLEDFLDLI